MIRALLFGQWQTGENSFAAWARPRIPKTGLLISLRCSVIAKAAAVATSRPRRVTVVKTRCKADYGPSEEEGRSAGGFETSVPKPGSDQLSVGDEGGSVATSRPRRVTVVKTRCKASRFYGPLVNEVEERLRRVRAWCAAVPARCAAAGSSSRSRCRSSGRRRGTRDRRRGSSSPRATLRSLSPVMMRIPPEAAPNRDVRER